MTLETVQGIIIPKGKMKLKFIAALLFVLSSFASATITCPGGGTPGAYGYCGNYQLPMIACQGSSANGCTSPPTGSYNIGYYTTGAGTGTIASPEAPAIKYSQFTGAPAYNTPNANGAVGTNQFIEIVNSGVQAFDKTTGNPIFVSTLGSMVTVPQHVNNPWVSYNWGTAGSPLKHYCGNLSIDGNMNYNRPGSKFMQTGVSNAASAFSPTLCMALPNSGNLQGTGGISYWTAYGFDLTNIIVTDAGTKASFDYPHFGTFTNSTGTKYYVTMDYIDQTVGSLDRNNVIGSAICELGASYFASATPVPLSATKCAVYLPARPTSRDTLWHSVLPADMDSSSSLSGTKGSYFIAQLNPWAAGTTWNITGQPCLAYSCSTSTSVLFWDEVAMFSGAAPTIQSVTGIYNTAISSINSCVVLGVNVIQCVINVASSSPIATADNIITSGTSSSFCNMFTAVTSVGPSYVKADFTACNGATGGNLEAFIMEMPGCYNPTNPTNTVCITQPIPATSTDQLDAVSDRLSGRFAYTYNGTYEMLAASSVVWNYTSSQGAPLQAIDVLEYSTFGTNPGSDPVYWSNNYIAGVIGQPGSFFSPAVAFDSHSNIGVVATYDSPVTSVSPPLPAYTVLNYSAPITWVNANNQMLVPSITGAGLSLHTGTCSTPCNVVSWGNYVSIMPDPTASPAHTFWGVTEFLNGNEFPGTLTWQTDMILF